MSDDLAEAAAAGGREENDAGDGDDLKKRGDIIVHRRRLGYALGSAGVVGVGGLLWFAFNALHGLARSEKESVIVAGLVAHAAVAIAGVFFCYQLIQAAERMLFPHWWLKRDVEMARLMLGVSDPISAAAKIVDKVSNATKK